MKLNTNKSLFEEQDVVTARIHIEEAIEWLFTHNQKDYKKAGIKKSFRHSAEPTGKEKLCLVCQELGYLQEKMLTKAQEKAAAKEQAMEQTLGNAASKEEAGMDMDVI